MDMRYARPRIWQTIFVGLCLVIMLVACLGQVVNPPTTAAGTLAMTLVEPISGFDQPVHVTHAGDGSGRLFVVEQAGRIRIVKDGAIIGTPFLNISSKVKCCGEEGLLSVAFPPGYAGKGHFYVYYILKDPANPDNDGDIIVARYRLAANNPDTADPASEQIVLQIDHTRNNHKGGQIAFGPDGYLYIGTGDGGGSGDPDKNGQKTTTLLGKVLRIDVETGSPATYTIPAGNPLTGAGDRREIWAYGVRNPWRLSFDRQTGGLYIADVGQNLYEEVNFQPAGQGGQNYGWNIMEGMNCYNAQTCNQNGLTLPVVEYEHSQGACSVTGGFVYRGSASPQLRGNYFYADYCNGRIWSFRIENGRAVGNTLQLDTGKNISSFGEDEAGNVYVVDIGGTISKIAGSTLATERRLYVPLVRK